MQKEDENTRAHYMQFQKQLNAKITDTVDRKTIYAQAKGAVDVGILTAEDNRVLSQDFVDVGIITAEEQMPKKRRKADHGAFWLVNAWECLNSQASIIPHLMQGLRSYQETLGITGHSMLKYCDHEAIAFMSTCMKEVPRALFLAMMEVSMEGESSVTLTNLISPQDIESLEKIQSAWSCLINIHNIRTSDSRVCSLEQYLDEFGILGPIYLRYCTLKHLKFISSCLKEIPCKAFVALTDGECSEWQTPRDTGVVVNPLFMIVPSVPC